MRIIAFIIVIIGLAFAWPHIFPQRKPTPVPEHTGQNAIFGNAESEYYHQMFNYQMDQVPADHPYAWQSPSIKSDLKVSASYVSKSGYTCRNYTEQLTVSGKPITNKGIACKRQGRDGWCRLKEGNALTCAMESPLIIPGINTPGVHVRVPGGSVNAGDMQGGGIGSVQQPHVNAPHLEAPNTEGSGQGYADTVTGTAGNAAGPATKGAFDMFNHLFR